MTRADATRFSAVIVFLVVGIAAPAAAQTTKGGFPQGTLVSANVTIPAGGSSQVVFTVPNDRVFVLTAFCSYFPLDLSGSTLGLLPFLNQRPTATHNCVNFAPGWVIPQAEVLTCFSSETPNVCGVSGILVKEEKKSPGPGR
jgi:hypothetical protein